jgi:hypothetical protein
MKNTKPTPDLRQTLDALDALTEEEMPAGWSRRSWVQREALAFGALVDPPPEPAAE